MDVNVYNVGSRARYRALRLADHHNLDALSLSTVGDIAIDGVAIAARRRVRTGMGRVMEIQCLTGA